MQNVESLPPQYRAAFKDADIRGQYPGEINEELAYRLGYYLGKEWKLSEIVVARDMRVSSPTLHKAVCTGLRQAGVTVYDLGLVPTTVMYFASGSWSTWGLMITASHNPADYNGFKIVQPGAVPLINASGLRRLRTCVTKTPPTHAKNVASQRARTITTKYLNAMRLAVPLSSQPQLRVVADAGNGMSACVLEHLQKLSGLRIKCINQTLDGTFPSRASNPMLRKNQRPIKAALQTGRYDFGVAFDGDGDRVAFFLPTGQMLNGALVGAIIAEQILQTAPGATCIDTVFTSRMYAETVKAVGGKVARAKVGHSYIKEQMRAKDAVFACEHSGHYYFKQNFYADSAVLALLYFTRALQAAGGDVKALIKPFQRYHQTEEVLIEVPNKQAVLQAVNKDYSKRAGVTVKRYDGVTVDEGAVWFTIKPSVTEDALKFVVESTSKSIAQAKQKEVHGLLTSFTTS